MTDTLQQRKTLPLPRELRDRVYRHLFNQRGDIVLGNGPFVSPRSNRSHPAIFRVSKSTGEEALSGFYKETTFRYCITFGKKYKDGKQSSEELTKSLDLCEFVFLFQSLPVHRSNH